MPRPKLTEAGFTRKINLIKKVFKRIEREERLGILKNRRLVNDVETQKRLLKEVGDEKVELQKDLLRKQYLNKVCDDDSVTLSNAFSSLLKEVNNIQEKITDSLTCIHVDNNGSQGLSRTNGSLQLPENVVTLASDDELSFSVCSSLNDSKDLELDHNAETISTHQPEPVVPNIDSVSSDKSEPGASGESSLPPKNKELPCNAETRSSNQPDLEVPKVENVSSTSEPGACGKSSLPTTSEILSGCSTSFYRRETVLLERNSFTEHNQQTNSDDCGSDEAFIGFIEDPIGKARSIERIERLSLACESLRSRTDDNSTCSLTVCERRPELENSSSSLESVWMREFNLQPVEISISRLDLLSLNPYQTMSTSTMSLIWSEQDKEAENNASRCQESRENSIVLPGSSTKPTISAEINNGSMKKKKVSTRKSNSSAITTPETHNRNDIPSSASCSLSNGRVPRRARKAVVSYKEKPLRDKMRR